MKTILILALTFLFIRPAAAQTPPVTCPPPQPAAAPAAQPALEAAPAKLVPIETAPNMAPAQPAGPDLITSPEPASFHPFHSTDTAVSAAQTQPSPNMPAPPAKKSSGTVAELKKQQAVELAKLRESLKDKPSAEIKKAVKAKKAEQKAAVKALEEELKAERNGAKK